MEFICMECGSTCCGQPVYNVTGLEVCSECNDKETIEDKGMNKSTYEICGICKNCLCNTLIDFDTELCEDCRDKGMTFTEALQKYKMITNDGGKTVYRTNSEGTVVMKTKGAGGAFRVTMELLTSTGWEEYKEKKLDKVKRYIGEAFYFINVVGDVREGREDFMSMDDAKFYNYNYFGDVELAQYVADKQLIQRIELTLTELNRGKFAKEEIRVLINQYLRDNHMDVLDRIIRYETK